MHHPDHNSDKKMKKKAKKKIIEVEKAPEEQANLLIEVSVKKRDSFDFSDDEGEKNKESGSIQNPSLEQVSSSSSGKPHWSLMIA
jgi:DnaJ-class molecular chaperone